MPVCRNRRVPALLLLLLAILPARAAAQETVQPTPVDSLATVRVQVRQWFPVPHRVQGRLMAADTGSVTVRPRGGADPVVVPLTKLRRMEVSLGRRTRGEGLRRGALEGLAAGAAFVTVLLATELVSGECEDCYFTPATIAREFGVHLIVTTTVSGAVGGTLWPGERWARVRPPVVLSPPQP